MTSKAISASGAIIGNNLPDMKVKHIEEVVFEAFRGTRPSLERVKEKLRQEKVVLMEHKDMPFLGLTVFHNNRFFVVTSKDAEEPELKYKVLLHELAHILLHSKYLDRYMLLSEKSEDREMLAIFDREADLFADIVMQSKLT